MKIPVAGRLILVAALAFLALQFVHPSIPTRPPAAEIAAPPEVKHVLERSCFSCHSDQTRLSWFDQIAPAYWLVRHDVLSAREHLDFSTLGSKPAAVQKAKLYEAVNMIQLGAMPLPQFSALHPEARLTPEDLTILKAYLSPWPALPAQTIAAAMPVQTANAAVRPEFNHLPFDLPTGWRLITVTDRGDNNTLRFVLGNDVAMQAVASGHISPWPDGARFAKIAWKKQAGPDGIVRPGDFVQVELMVKDAQRFKSTDGWGWGRWVGSDLKPYGADAHFVNECTGCHLPVRRDDYVYTLPITPAQVSGREIVNNRAASLPASLPFQPLGWRPITLFVDPRTLTIAALFGNEEAARSVQAGIAAGNQSEPTYQPGSVLALVTWAERDDPHWFGARIPDLPRSVEFVQVDGAGKPDSYRRFAGPDLTEERLDVQTQQHRDQSIRSLVPAALPW